MDSWTDRASNIPTERGVESRSTRLEITGGLAKKRETGQIWKQKGSHENRTADMEIERQIRRASQLTERQNE